MKFAKYHALGNDYIVIEPDEFPKPLTGEAIQRICHRNYGVGSDGILLGPLEASGYDFALRIFNPDGSEAEKSGNGLRIFSRYLFDAGRVGTDPFNMLTAGGPVTSRIDPGGRLIAVEMGTVSFHSADIPVTGDQREVLNETLNVGDVPLTFCAATVGNPHCVVVDAEVSAEKTKQLGPLIETDPRFPNRTNVQFMEVLDRNTIRIEIWERGAGYTLASGSSSSAAAAVARKLGLCGPEIRVEMPGGHIDITISEDFSISMTGPVTRVADGIIHDEIFS